MEQAAEASRAGLRTRRERIITPGAADSPDLGGRVRGLADRHRAGGSRAAVLRAHLRRRDARPDRGRASPPRGGAGDRGGRGNRHRRPARGRHRHRHLADRRDLRPRDAGRHAGGRRAAAGVAGRRLRRTRGDAPAARGRFDFDRALDALVGSGTALVVGSLLLPVDPVRLVQGGARPGARPARRGARRDRRRARATRRSRGGAGAHRRRARGCPLRPPHRDARRGRRRRAHLARTAAAGSTGSTATWPPWARLAWRSRTCERWRAARCGRSRSTTARLPR